METTLDTIRDIRLYQPRDGYRFSMDALLLFSFVEMPVVKSISDLGAGSGIIGILLAGRYPEAQTVLLEIQEAYVNLAERNITMNALEGRVSAITLTALHPVRCRSSPTRSPRRYPTPTDAS